MINEWIVCLGLAMFIYFNADDIFPGSWLSNNIFFDSHDKYPYHIKKQL